MAFFGPKIDKKVVNFWRRSPRCTLILPPKIRVFLGPFSVRFEKTAFLLFFPTYTGEVFRGTGRVAQKSLKKWSKKHVFSHYFGILDPLWKFSCRLGVEWCQKSCILVDFGQKPFFPLPKFRAILDLFFTILNPVASRLEIFDFWKMIIFGSQKKSRFWPLFFIFFTF